MPRAGEVIIDLLTEYFAAMQAKDIDRMRSYYSDDMTLTFANAPTVTGEEAVLAQMTTLLAKVESLVHPLINVWPEDDGVVVFEVASVWRFPDGAEATMNAWTIFTIADGKFTDQRIFSTSAPSTPTSAEGPVTGVPPSAA